MSVPEPFAISDRPAPPENEWGKRWRSDCIDQFSAIEHRLRTLLQYMAADKKRGSKVKASLYLLGQAYEEVKRLTSAKGTFAIEGRAIAKTLISLEAQLDWRVHLTHGQLDEWKCKKGSRHLLTLKLFDENATGCTRYHAYPQAEAEERLSALTKIAHDLTSQAGHVREALSPKKQTPGPAGTPS